MGEITIKVSVIIPVYNVSAYIERCLQSVISQTYSDFECILVDDCGTDDSIAKCEKMITAYRGAIRFRILHHERNRGLSAARNTGTEAATGDYILYVDSDDAITNDCIEKLMAPIMRDDSVEMVVGDFELYEVDSQLAKHSKSIDSGEYTTLQTVRLCFFQQKGFSNYAWNRLIKKDFLIRFGLLYKEGLLWEDDLWLFFVMKHLTHLYIIKDVTYRYYRRPDSITMNTNIKKRQYHWGIIYSEISNNFTTGDSRMEIKYHIKGFCKYYIDCYTNELYIKAFYNFRKELSILHDPIECVLLFATGIMSRTKMGRSTFHSLEKTYKVIRGKLLKGCS